MMRQLWTVLFLYVVTSGLSVVAQEHDDWQYLLDENLSKWEVYLGVPHKSVKVPGHPTSTSDDGITGESLGLGDPLKVFTVKIVEGEPVLQITGEVYGGLTSVDVYESYHLSVEFRWGDEKWPPRLNRKRDSGLLFHCVGKHGAFWNVWMRSLECQVQEGDCGDFIPLAGSQASLFARPDTVDKRPVYDPTGQIVASTGYASHGPSEEKPHGEWNTAEIYTIRDQAVFVINGTPNMALFRTRQNSPQGQIPLTSGRIQIQSEAAEIEYRRVKIRTIDAFPDSLKDHVR